MGSGGFIGSSLCSHLRKEHNQVMEIGSHTPLLKNQDLAESIHELDALIWAASRVNPITAETRPDLLDIELVEWRAFLHAWHKHFGATRPIYFLSSGGCVYSSSKMPLNELSEARGINKYGELKVQMEIELASSGIPGTILRISNVYGQNQPHGRGQGVVAEWKKALQSGENIKVFGSTESFRDYVYIDDVVSAVTKVLSLEAKPRVFNVGSGVATTLSEILEVVESLKSPNTEIQFFEGRKTDRLGYYLDISALKMAIHWEPETTIEVGLARIFRLTLGH